MKATVLKDFAYIKEGHKIYSKSKEWNGPKSEYDRINAHEKGPFLKAETEEAQPEKAEGYPVTAKAEKRGRKKNETK